MSDAQLAQILNSCLERIRHGETVEDCLHDYPQVADELAAMLEAGLLAQKAQSPFIEAREAQARVRLRFEDALQTEFPARRSYPVRAILSLAASLILILFAGIVITAQGSLPGDSLYAIKGLTENVQLFLSNDNANLQANFDARRVNETRQLLTLGREAEVTFSGEVESITGGEAVIAEIPVRVSADMPLLLVGDRVRVQGITAQNHIVAMSIEILSRPDTPETTPSPALTPATTPPERPTETPTPTFSPTTTPSTTMTETPNIARPSATATPQANCQVSPPNGWVQYRVQTGDSLSVIAERVNTSMEQIIRVNCLTNARLITVGQTLYLPRMMERPTFDLQTPESEPSATAIGHRNDSGQNNSEPTIGPTRRPANAGPQPTATKRNQNN